MTAIWQKTYAQRGTRMIFSDMGVRQTPWRYSVYGDIMEKLVRNGLPREQIAAVGDADTDAKKQVLFETARQAEDIDGQELSDAEVKAVASGNPAVLTLAEADAEIKRLTLLKKHHGDEQDLARQALRDLPQTIARLERRLAALTQDMETARAHQNDAPIISKTGDGPHQATGAAAGRTGSPCRDRSPCPRNMR